MSFQTGARIFPCAQCGEMIYSDSAACRFCQAPVDRYAAEAAADVQKNVNHAVNMAKWVRNTAGVMWVLVALGTVFGTALIGALLCMFTIPISLIYWQSNFARITTTDADYTKAKRDRLIALVLWLTASVFQVLMILVRIIV